MTTVSFPDYATPIGTELHRALHGERDYGPDVIQMLMIANRYEWKPAIVEAQDGGRRSSSPTATWRRAWPTARRRGSIPSGCSRRRGTCRRRR